MLDIIETAHEDMYPKLTATELKAELYSRRATVGGIQKFIEKMECDFENLEKLNNPMSEPEKAAVLILAIPEQLSHLQTVLNTIKATYANAKKIILKEAEKVNTTSEPATLFVGHNKPKQTQQSQRGNGREYNKSPVHKEKKPGHVSDAERRATFNGIVQYTKESKEVV